MRRYAWLVAGVLGFVGVTATPALAEDPGGKVSIEVDNGTDRVAAEGTVDYTIEVHNAGPDMPSAVISQLLPAALDYQSARPKPSDAEVNQVQWRVDLAKGETVKLRMTGRVGRLGSIDAYEGKRRLTSTVCVAPADDQPLAACSTESDPVGPPAPPDDETERVVVPAAVGVVVAGGGGYLWYRRRNGRPLDDE